MKINTKKGEKDIMTIFFTFFYPILNLKNCSLSFSNVCSYNVDKGSDKI